MNFLSYVTRFHANTNLKTMHVPWYDRWVQQWFSEIKLSQFESWCQEKFFKHILYLHKYSIIHAKLTVILFDFLFQFFFSPRNGED